MFKYLLSIFTGLIFISYANATDTALVVIDMQESFKSAQEVNLNSNIKKVIQKMDAVSVPIFFVTSSEFGSINNSLTDSLKSFEVTVKSKTSGGDELLAILAKNYPDVRKLVICGVNTDYCVKDTVSDLASSSSLKLFVLKDCCRCNNSISHLAGLESIVLIARTSVIHSKLLVLQGDEIIDELREMYDL